MDTWMDVKRDSVNLMTLASCCREKRKEADRTEQIEYIS